MECGELKAKVDGIKEVDLNERLHIDASGVCNNNCIFCMEEDRESRQARIDAIAPQEIRAILEANVFRREMMLVSGEPTLSPHFHKYLYWAKKAGYEVVGAISNGRRFSYLPFTELAMKAGLNHVIISIHGGNARLHDGLVRARGAFDQALEGIRNLASFKDKGYEITIHTSTVVNRRNAPPEAMEELYTLLRPYVDQFVFNVMQPWGRGSTFFEKLVAPYTEIAESFAAFLALHPGEELPVFLLDIPYCVTEGKGIPDMNRGYIERYVHFDKSDDGDDTWSETPDLDEVGGVIAGGAAAKQGVDMGADSGAEGFVAHSRDTQDMKTKAKRAECHQCAYFHVCDGVWRIYLKKMGWDEFQPVART